MHLCALPLTCTISGLWPDVNCLRLPLTLSMAVRMTNWVWCAIAKPLATINCCHATSTTSRHGISQPRCLAESTQVRSASHRLEWPACFALAPTACLPPRPRKRMCPFYYPVQAISELKTPHKLRPITYGFRCTQQAITESTWTWCGAHARPKSEYW